MPAKKPADFELTACGLADEWVFYSTAHAGREKRDKPKGILPMIEQTIAAGVTPQAIRDGIRDKKRNRNEWYSDFERRITQAAGIKTGTKPKTDAEILGPFQRFAERGK